MRVQEEQERTSRRVDRHLRGVRLESEEEKREKGEDRNVPKRRKGITTMRYVITENSTDLTMQDIPQHITEAAHTFQTDS